MYMKSTLYIYNIYLRILMFLSIPAFANMWRSFVWVYSI